MWEGAGAKWTALLTPEAIEESVAYTILNCVEAGLVPVARAWGGFSTLPESLGTERVVRRPALRYFTERSVMPEEVTLRIEVPTSHVRMGPEAWARRIGALVRRGEAEHQARIGKGNFAGMSKVLARSRDTKAATREELRAPTPMAKAGSVANAKALIDGFRELFGHFLKAYHAAYEVFRAEGRALFPWGTWRWHRQAGQCCADPPPTLRAVA